jgi:uncharacterized protein (DUF433 family)
MVAVGLDTGQIANRVRTGTLPSPSGRTGRTVQLFKIDWRQTRWRFGLRYRPVSIASMWYNVSMKEDQRIYQERIVADPRILAGKPVVKGTRIAVDLVLEELSHNPDIAELLAAHPDLTRDDVQACLAYAQAIVTGEEVSPKPPKGGRVNAAL